MAGLLPEPLATEFEQILAIGHQQRPHTAVPAGRRPELQGGGLVRSLGGWAAVRALRRGREAYLGDERVLGSPGFVEWSRCGTRSPRRNLPRL